MSSIRTDKELEQFRNLMTVPSTFEDGFNWSSLVGAIFIALLMVPGAMYMKLLAGIGVGPAAQWVTVILFIEVARRAHKNLKRAEIFVLFYMAGAAMGEPFSGLMWNQFLVQSQAAIGTGVAEKIPIWVAPSDPAILATRSFFNPAWYPAIGLIVFTLICGRLNSTILSYGLFRVASDIEKLPFPMAPIGAQGIMALAEQQTEEGPQKNKKAGGSEDTSWRWRVFCVGGILGLVFGFFYMAIPAVSGAVLGKPITIFPIPFVDWTSKTSEFLPAVATGLSLNLGQLVTGMVLPFFAMLGSFIGLIVTVVANPILYHFQMLPSWSPQDDTIKTLFHNNIDFYFSFSIGISIAIAIAGFYQVYRGIRERIAKRKKMKNDAALMEASINEQADEVERRKDRGDIPFPIVIGTYILTSSAYILVSGFLIDWHPAVMKVLIFFAFLYTPIISYVTARLEGLAGQVVQIPMVREAAFILSGYQGGVKVWFLPIPLANYGQRTVFYRQAELTGTKFWSIWKTEILLFPIVMISSILFSQFIWSTSSGVPGPEFPFAQTMWELQAANQCVIYSSTLGRFSTFGQAFRWDYLLTGAGFGVVLFSLMYMLHLPIMLTYGVVRGLNQTMPHTVLPQFVGALIGRFYFQKRLGLKWRQYIPVVAAGFSCGMGLITVFGVGLNFLAKSVIKISF